MRLFVTLSIDLSKEVLAEQLYEVCETLKSDESDLLVQGLENLQKELLGTPLRKMKANALKVGGKLSGENSSSDKMVSSQVT